jgi:hypothetical protein
VAAPYAILTRKSNDTTTKLVLSLAERRIKMVSKLKVSFLLVFSITFGSRIALSSQPNAADLAVAKAELIEMAQSFAGQADPDRSKQNALEPLVQKLLALSPQPPVAERLKFLQAPWKQVWGPYTYKDDNRGIDPDLGIEEIYQVVFEGGYYYNVSPVFKNGDKNQIRTGFLRGEYTLDARHKNAINVRFKRYPGIEGRPKDGRQIWELAKDAEAGTLIDQITIVPTWIVRLFFGGGSLNEVYTDADLRITYGADTTEFKDDYLYVMTRAK